MVSEDLHAMIPDYVRGLLSPSEAKEVESALEGSPEILPEFEAAQSYYAALNQIPEVKAPADFLGRVNRRIDTRPLDQRLRSLLFEPLALKLPIGLAGVAACLIAALFLVNPFSTRGRLPSDKSVASAGRPSAAPAPAPAAETVPAPAPVSPPPAEETKNAVLPPTPEPAAAAPAAQPKPPEDIAMADAEKTAPLQTQKPAAAAKDESTTRPAGLAFAKTAEQKPAATAEVARKKMAREEEAPAAAASEKKTEAKPAVTAPPPAAIARRAAPSAGPSIDAIPTLPAVAMAAPAPRAPAAPAAAPSPRAETQAAREPLRPAEIAPKSSKAEDIGTVDLAPDWGSTMPSGTDNVEEILRTSSVRCVQTAKDGKTAYLCTLPPERLNLLIVSLSRSFEVTTHLFPYDITTATMVAVTFVIVK
jgi:hypothetical protein